MDDYTVELEQVRKTNGGVLRPLDVVDYARNPKSALHQRFEWDDSAAALQHRLSQARELIRVVVQTKSADDNPVRVYVSLKGDQAKTGGGYRTLTNVLRSKAMREALLGEARAEMLRFESKYSQLSELASVIAEMQAVRG